MQRVSVIFTNSCCNNIQIWNSKAYEKLLGTEINKKKRRKWKRGTKWEGDERIACGDRWKDLSISVMSLSAPHVLYIYFNSGGNLDQSHFSEK